MRLESALKIAAGLVALAVLVTVPLMRAVSSEGAEEVSFAVVPGEGFSEVVTRLEEEGLVRAPRIFTLYLLGSGKARTLKPGTYTLSPSMSGWEVARTLVTGSEREVVVTVPEGMSSYLIDGILAEHGILPQGALISEVEEGGHEGSLFPDTYRFFVDSEVEEVLERFFVNFEARAAPLLALHPDRIKENLIVASILEREVPEEEDRRIVAGIIWKRISAGMPIQVDATICYIKEMQTLGGRCHPFSGADFRIDSPYNTYLYLGLPPGPIGNPGEEAIQAALSPQSSPYWFYLSDPATGETHFSETLEEHEEKRWRYILGV